MNRIVGSFQNAVRSARVPNTGSVARDHLANERTFLAWARTSLAFVAAGLGLGALNDGVSFLDPARRNALSVAFVSLGGTLMCLSVHRYFSIIHDLNAGVFRPNILGVLTLVAASAGLPALCLGMTSATGHPLMSFSSAVRSPSSRSPPVTEDGVACGMCSASTPEDVHSQPSFVGYWLARVRGDAVQRNVAGADVGTACRTCEPAPCRCRYVSMCQCQPSPQANKGS
eukprot:TRINITY_DN37322_c0_g1_i1.p1 TRINITY_DN37322_c0_g1~~TRINITY_DN37322_c0_g1_i1.p1  ORF type:complete len:228 (+),score=14.79 TRINITY_DN37322_c0_g1_i1:118-801(+)